MALLSVSMDRPAPPHPPLLSLGREIQTISEMMCCIFTFFEECRMKEIQQLMMLSGLSAIIFYRTFEKLE